MIDLEDSEIQPFVINRFLAMNDRVRIQARWLDQYAFSLPSKMWLSLAWSTIPKSTKAPFVKYIKQVDTEEKLDFLIKRIRHHMKMSDNDWRANRTRVIEHINANTADWFKFYGIERTHWRDFNVDFNKMQEETNGKPKSIFDY